MLRYRCLVLDHDDTVVRSAETVNYPQFLQVLAALRPGRQLTLEAYLTGSIDPGFHAMCRQWFGFTPAEMDWMFRAWQQYVQTHIPPAYDGIAQILRRQRALGGLLCVSSHSSPANITRDWQRHFGMTPDEIFGWELGPEKRKPSPYALQQIMRHYGLAPQQLVVIDDLKPGYEMAKRCSVDFIAAGWSHRFPEIRRIMQENGDYYMQTVENLEKFLFS